MHGDAVYGLADVELATFVNAVDLLIVGSRSYGQMKRMTLGGASCYLQRHARCSLLATSRNLLAEAAGEEEQADPQSIPEPAKPHAGVR